MLPVYCDYKAGQHDRHALIKMGLALLFSGIFCSTAFSQIDYSTQIQPIFDDNCTSCHYDGQSGVTLTTYRAAMKSVGSQYEMNVIVPGEPDNSPLVDKIEPNPEIGSRMPQVGSLTEAQIDTIRQWIAEGANEEVSTAIQNNNERPKILELHGNYPNPFNPSTQIKLTVNQTAVIRLRIINLKGKLIQEKTLESVRGRVTVPLSFNRQTSGLYLYTVSAFNNNKKLQESTGRMLLIK